MEFVIVFPVILSLGLVVPSDPAKEQRDLAGEVRAIVSARCAGCHGPNLVKPKGRFGYVTDLKRVASNGEMVVPGNPAESELWEKVRRGEMPPADSPTGPLTAQQKEVIKAWIAAGAPSDSPSSANPQPSAIADGEGSARPMPVSAGRRFVTWIGNFHLLFLHFPIALLAAAAIGEAWALLRNQRVPLPGVRFCVLLAAPAAICTSALGWLHALGGNGAGMPATLALHRWLGTAAGAWAVILLVFSERDARRGERSLPCRALLFVGAALTAVAAHFGGLLAHGPDFFDW